MNEISDRALAESAAKYNDQTTIIKAEFYTLADQIMLSYKKGYSIKAIWRCLYDGHQISIKYGQFYNMFKRFQKSQEEGL